MNFNHMQEAPAILVVEYGLTKPDDLDALVENIHDNIKKYVNIWQVGDSNYKSHGLARTMVDRCRLFAAI